MFYHQSPRKGKGVCSRFCLFVCLISTLASSFKYTICKYVWFLWKWGQGQTKSVAHLMNISGQPSFTDSAPKSLFCAFLTNQVDYCNEIQDFQQSPGHAVVCPELSQAADMHLDLATYHPYAHKSPLSYSVTWSSDWIHCGQFIQHKSSTRRNSLWRVKPGLVQVLYVSKGILLSQLVERWHPNLK